LEPPAGVTDPVAERRRVVDPRLQFEFEHRIASQTASVASRVAKVA
jgi:hypothetical protein